MRILITNDDGIRAEGIRALADWARKLGEVSVFAPEVEQSGKSIGLELHKAFKATKVEYDGAVEAYCVSSTPADCVRFAVLGLKRKYDLVLSGVNRGMNVGYDINYSGTVGAVCEAAMQGIKGIAVSTSATGLGAAAANFDRVYDYFVKRDLLSKCDIYNVNIPDEPGEIVITGQGGVYYSDFYPAVGGDMYLPTAVLAHDYRADKSVDTDAVRLGCISISPLTYLKTDFRVLDELK
ncbi:MAG: 5'/3'-nucleotidase SurE [Eubacteriales bacterium]